MTEQYNDTNRPIHDLARFSYLQEMVTHKRVLLIEGDIKLATFLANARARYICSISDRPMVDLGVAAGTVDVQQMSPYDMQFRDGSFDLVVLPNIGVFDRPQAVLGECRRILDRSGHLIAASPSPECAQRLGPDPSNQPLDYYDFFDLLSEPFPSVQMAAQSPFVGYTLSDLGSEDAEPAIAVDQSLLGEEGEDIEWFLAICGERFAPLEALSIVQIPILDAGIGRAKLTEVVSAKDNAQSLQTELEDLQQAYSQLKEDLSDARTRAGELDRIAKQKGQLEQEVQDLKQNTERLAELEKDIDDARRELGNRGVRIGQLENDLEAEKVDAEAARERGVKLAKELDEERKAAQSKQIEEEYQKRTATMELQSQLHEAELKLKQADARSHAAESAHDDIIDRMRADGVELDRLRETADKLKDKLDSVVAREKELQRTADKLKPLVEELRTAKQYLGNQEASIVDSIKTLQAGLDKANAKADSAGKFKEERTELEKEIASLEEQLRRVGKARRDAEEEIERREAIIRDLVVKLETKENESSSSGSKVGALQKELTEAGQTIEEMQSKHVELREQLTQSEELLATSQGTIAGHHRSRVEAELALATVELQFKKVQERVESIGELEQSNQNLIDELSEMRQKHDDTAREFTALKDKIKERQVELAQRDQRIAELEGKIQAAEWKLSELEARASATPEVDITLATKIQETQQELTSLKTENEELTASLAKAAEALDGHHRARVELELQLATQSKKAAEQEKKFADQAALIAELNHRLADASATSGGETDARIKELTQLLGTAERGAKLLEDTTDQQRGRIGDLEQAVKTAKDRIVELEKDLSTAEAGSHRMEDTLADERKKIGAEKDRIAELENLVAELQIVKDGAKGDQSSFQEKILSQEDRIVSLQNEIGILKQRVRDAEAGLEEETKRAEAEIASLKAAMNQQATSSEEELVARLNELEQNTAKASADLAAERSKAESFKNSIDVLQSQLKEEVERSRAAGADAARLARDESDTKEKLNDQERTINDLQASLEAGDRALVALRDEMARIEKEQKEAGSLAAKADAFEAQLKPLKEQIASVNDLNSKLQAEKEAAQKRIEELTEQRLEAEKNAAKVASEKYEQQARKLQEELEQSAQKHSLQLKELEEKLEQTGSNRSKLQQELDELRVDTVRHQKESASTQKEIEFLKSKMADQEKAELEARQVAKQLEEEATKLRSASSGNKEQEASLNRELAELKLTAVKQAKELKRLSVDSKDKESLLETLTAQLDERQKRASKLEKQIKEQESDAAAWEMEVQFRNKRVEQLESEIGKLKTDAQNTGGNGEQMQGEFDRLNRRLSETDTKLRMLTNHNQNTWQKVKQANAALRDLLNKGQISPQAVHTVKNIIAALESS